MMNPIVSEIATNLIRLIIVPAMIYLIVLARNYIYTKIVNEKIKDIFWQAGDAVIKAVDMTSQTFVDNIKGTDKWTTETMREAANKALESAKQILSKDGYNLLNQATGDANAWLTCAIEQHVKLTKTR